MAARVLHVLDATTPSDAMDILAPLLPRHEHRLVGLGHRSTQQLARGAGIDEPITFVHAMGWADPTGWRGLRRVIREYAPTHVHAWGIPAAIGVSMSRFKGRRLVSLVDMPHGGYLRLLQFIHKGGLWMSVSPCHWTVTTTWLKRVLHAHGIAADAVTLIRPAVCPPASTFPARPEVNGTWGTARGAGLLLSPTFPVRPEVNGARAELGLLPEDGPVILLGGDGGSGTVLAQPGMDPQPHGGRGGPRHDLGLWAAAILQLIFPRIRAIVREDPRGRPDPGLERLINNLADEAVVVVAPAQWPWGKLLGVADVLLVTPDGPFAAGSIMQAFAAQVPVVGTPVDAVREHITDGHNGLLTASTRPREIAAALERFFNEPELRTRLTQQALADAETRHDLGALLRGYEALYG